MNGAQAIVEMLKAYRVRYIFGLPGDTSISFYAALADARADLTHILVREERSAGYMADAYARVSGRVGVCEAPSGAGATYLAPGIAEAHATSIPVIAITTDTPLRGENKNVLTAFDQSALFAPITKARFQIKRADKIPETIRRAFRLATTGRPGAIHLSAPQDVLDEASRADIYAEDDCQTFPAYRTRADADAIIRAADLLLRAERPIIVAGGGVVTSGAWRELTALTETLAAPVATTITGKGSMDETHPLSIGVIGGNGGRTYANQMLADADVIFYIGANTDSVTTINWTLPAPASGKTIIQSDVDPVEIGNNYPLGAGLVGDAKLVLADLLDAITRVPGARVLSARQKQMMDDGAAVWWDEFRQQAAERALPLKPQQIVAALTEILPENSIVVADAGTPTPHIAAYFRSRAGRRVIIPRGYGGLGYALPAAMGAKLARPDATVVALMGDGSFGMVATEFETLRRLGLPITVVQFSNAAFGWIKKLQQLHGTPFYQSDFSADTDHAAIVRGFGVAGIKMDRPHDLAEVLHDAVRASAPNFIDVPSADEVAAMPPMPQWRKARPD